ncbi:hypothetical protein AAFF_G00213340, partial [Aldrovandia affinis]
MADGRQPQDSGPQWVPPGAQQDQAPPAGHSENGYSSYRSCQPGEGSASYSAAKENGFNGDLSGGHVVTAVEDSANLPPSPPPSPSAEQFGPLEQDVGDEEEARPLQRFQNSRERCKFLAPSISVSVPDDDPSHSDEEYFEHPLFSPEWTRHGYCPSGQAAAFRQIEEESVEALAAAAEEEETAAAAAPGEQEQQRSGEEPERGPEAEPLEQAENLGKAQARPCPQAEAASETARAPNGSGDEAGLEKCPEEALKMDEGKPDSGLAAATADSDLAEKHLEELPALLSPAPHASEKDKEAHSKAAPESSAPVPSNGQSHPKEATEPTQKQSDIPPQQPVEQGKREEKTDPSKASAEKEDRSTPKTAAEEHAHKDAHKDSGVTDESVRSKDSQDGEEMRMDDKPKGISGEKDVKSDDKKDKEMTMGVESKDIKEKAGETSESKVEALASEVKKTEAHQGASNVKPAEASEKEEAKGQAVSVDTKGNVETPDQRKSVSEKEGLKMRMDTADRLDDLDVGKDKSGMSAYFETSALKEDEGQGEGYYELSDTREKKISEPAAAPSPPEIGYTTLARAQSPHSFTDARLSPVEDLRAFPVTERKDEGKLSPGKLSLEQRSYSLNIPIAPMDQSSGQGQLRNFSPLATDIMSYTSGSLDESADYLPVTTPVVEKKPAFPPRILETAPSVSTPPSSPPDVTTSPTSSPQSESPGLPFPIKFSIKNGAIMAPDLPEMLDLAGARTRLTSDSSDSEMMRRKSVPANVLMSDSLAHLLLGDKNQKAARSESQLEEMGYCVFNEYSGPMPSPADVHSPFDSPPQIFTTVISEEEDTGAKESIATGEGEVQKAQDQKVEAEEKETKRKTVEEVEMAEGKGAVEVKIECAVGEESKETVLIKGVSADDSKSKPAIKPAEPFEEKPKELGLKIGLKGQIIPEVEELDLSREASPVPPDRFVTEAVQVQPDRSAGFFITPTVTVTPDETEPGRDATLTTEAEIADAEKKIRKLEMESRPLSLEEERELQELREKVKDKPDLVHQEAYEEVDAEDVYQLAGVAKERIKRPVKPSPASSVESATEEEKVAVHEPKKLQQPEEEAVSPKAEPTKQEAPEEGAREASAKPEEPAPVTTTVQVEQREEEDDDEDVELAEEPEEVMEEVQPPAFLGKEKEKEVAKEEGAIAAAKEPSEPRAIIESVVTVEDDFITVVQTIDAGEQPGHSVRFSAPPEDDQPQAPQEEEEEEEEEEESIEIAQEVALEAASLEDISDVAEVPEMTTSPVREPASESELQPETYDDYKDETTIDDSILDTDSAWADTQDDDRSIVTEKIEPLPKTSPAKKPSEEKRTKGRASGRAKGRVSTPEHRPVRREPSSGPRDEIRKKKAVIKKADLTKKSDTRSPSRKSAFKPAARQPRPVQHNVCAKRKPAAMAVTDGRQPLSVAQKTRERTADGSSRSPEKRSSLPRPASILTRRTQPAEQDETSTSITSSGSTAPRRPTSFRTEGRAEHRTGRAPSMTGAETSARARPAAAAPRPGPPAPRPLLSQEKRVAIIRTPPKSPATTPKQLRVLNQPLPDLKNVRSKIGSTDNIKYQPKGGQ